MTRALNVSVPSLSSRSALKPSAARGSNIVLKARISELALVGEAKGILGDRAGQRPKAMMTGSSLRVRGTAWSATGYDLTTQSKRTQSCSAG